jgi:hypothetical protein
MSPWDKYTTNEYFPKSTRSLLDARAGDAASTKFKAAIAMPVWTASESGSNTE